jgi:hypothetical protein
MSTITDQTMRAISPTGWGGAELSRTAADEFERPRRFTC